MRPAPGVKHFHHPVVGDLSLTYDRMDPVADPRLTIFTYTAARLAVRRGPEAARELGGDTPTRPSRRARA
jgi:hypothetical protein